MLNKTFCKMQHLHWLRYEARYLYLHTVHLSSYPGNIWRMLFLSKEWRATNMFIISASISSIEFRLGEISITRPLLTVRGGGGEGGSSNCTISFNWADERCYTGHCYSAVLIFCVSTASCSQQQQQEAAGNKTPIVVHTFHLVRWQVPSVLEL